MTCLKPAQHSKTLSFKKEKQKKKEKTQKSMKKGNDFYQMAESQSAK